MEMVDVCYYENMSILDVYDAMSFVPEYNFSVKIGIGENRSVAYRDENTRVLVDYKWKGKNKLEVIQHFEGGEMSYIFKHKKMGQN